MKLCSRCKSSEPRSGQRYCFACHADAMREWRKTHPLKGEARKKQNTRAYSRVLLTRGRIERKPCEKCGSAQAQMHHDDYANPRNVRWLCRPCHLDHHREAVA